MKSQYCVCCEWDIEGEILHPLAYTVLSYYHMWDEIKAKGKV